MRVDGIDILQFLYWRSSWNVVVILGISGGRGCLSRRVVRLALWSFVGGRACKGQDDSQASVEITASELSLLLGGIDLRSAERRKRFQRPAQPR